MISDLNVGVLYIFAISSSLGVYGIIMGGWASNSKYPFLGGLAVCGADGQSYEVSIGFIIIGIMLVDRLAEPVRGRARARRIIRFPVLMVLVAAFPDGDPVLRVSALAETNRPPFDLPEAESELVAGYQVEYSSTPYLLFMIGEYMNIVLMCVLTTILFFGGWLSPIPGLPDGVLWLVAKSVAIFFMFAMVKAIVPRYRYDQLMRLGWKVFLPMSLAWVVIAATFAFMDVPGYARWATGG